MGDLDCRDVRDDLHSLLLNELTDEELSPILAHLAGCEGCKLALTQHARLLGILKTEFPDLNRVIQGHNN